MIEHVESEEHIVSWRVYVGIFAALMALTALTVWAAFQDFGTLNVTIALGIAIVKATLVILFFMHVSHSSRLTQLIVASGVFGLLILFTFTLADYLTRNWDSIFS